MRHDKHNILVTRPLAGQQIEYARVMGLQPVIKPALEFEFPEYWDDVLKTINDNAKSEWVFTSANAVKALEQLMRSGLQVRPNTQLFAVGSNPGSTAGPRPLMLKFPTHKMQNIWPN
ncbi:MAG: uroporphyrinogen-III synthase [Balneolaceae bacterium]|nr:uroporphyrinogen-III synthase [Balneolaceae bacterium]